MGLNRAVGMVVEEATRFARPKGGVLLRGPMIGLPPEPGQPLLLTGAFGSPQRVRCAAMIQSHRGETPGQLDLIVTGLDDSAPAYYRGALLYEEGVSFRPFGALLKAAMQHQRSAARFDFPGDRAYGFIVIAGGVLDAFVIGGGLPDGQNLWQYLVRMVTPSGTVIAPESLRSTCPGWPVSSFPVYDRARGEHSVLMARACGPAELGREVLVRLSTTSLTADVLSQQKANGMVQIEAGMAVRQLPAFLIASPTSPFDGQRQVALG